MRSGQAVERGRGGGIEVGPVQHGSTRNVAFRTRGKGTGQRGLGSLLVWAKAGLVWPGPPLLKGSQKSRFFYTP